MFLMSNSYVSNLDKPTIIYKGEEDEMVKFDSIVEFKYRKYLFRN